MHVKLGSVFTDNRDQKYARLYILYTQVKFIRLGRTNSQIVWYLFMQGVALFLNMNTYIYSSIIRQ